VAPVTLITAPAGFGKTTLAAQWAAQTQRHTAWLSLRTESNSSDRFLRDLLASLHQIVGFENGAAVAAPTIEDVLTVAQRAVRSGPATLVIDDYHNIESNDIVRLTELLIRELPSAFALLIISRERPPLFLGRLRLNGLVREITETELRFAQSEVQELAKSEFLDHLSNEQIQRLAERTDGWIAGIRLAFMAVQSGGTGQHEDLVSEFSTTQWLDDYVVEEVISRLPDDLGDFVLRTASFDSLEPDLCDAVLQIQHGASRIEELRRKLVFLRRDQYPDAPLRYHALFAECVTRIAARRFSSDVKQDLHTRAGNWLESQGRVEMAIEHYLLGDDLSAAIRLTSDLCHALLNQGQFGSILYWLSKLPRETILADPNLVYWNVRALLQAGRLREGRALQLEAEPGWRASLEPTQLGYASATRSLVEDIEGDIVNPLYLCYRALHWFPADRFIERFHAWSAVAFYEFVRGNDELGHQAFRQAERTLTRLPGNHQRWSAVVAADRANWYAVRGDLVAAERLLTHSINQLTVELHDEGAKLRSRRTAIYLEWNQLEKARADVEHVLADIERFPPIFWWAGGLIVVARVLWASGERDRASTILQHVLEVTDAGGSGLFGASARALQASHWIETGDLELTRYWSEFRPEIGDQWPRGFGGVDIAAPQIQLLVAEGSYAEASAMARERIKEGQEAKQWSAIIPLYLWEFVAQMHLGDDSAARKALSAALQIGKEGGFVRSFSPPGVDIIPWLLTSLPHLPAEEADYLRQVIGQLAPAVAVPSAISVDGAISAGSGAAPYSGTAGPDVTLSRREEQVLSLLSQGTSNRRIADELFISENTVKKHISNIFAKLSVSNRTAAILRARELDILD
jgi:LuxR family maltose regulon positive regulatory protein